MILKRWKVEFVNPILIVRSDMTFKVLGMHKYIYLLLFVFHIPVGTFLTWTTDYSVFDEQGCKMYIQK